MDKNTKLKIKYGIFSGLGFAGFMAGFDFLDGEGFRLFRFMINFLFFGISMGFMTRINFGKQLEKEKE